MITGAYKAVGGLVLEKEVAIPSIILYLVKLVVNSVKRAEEPVIKRTI